MKDLNKNFKESINDLIWLLDRGYPKNNSIELVGNRYRLNSEERKILYRGVFDTKSVIDRRIKRINPYYFRVNSITIDGYNVFITLESYLSGRLVFRATDGYVRDISGVYGNYTFSNLTKKCVDLIIDLIKSLEKIYFSKIDGFVYLDSPVSKSGELASYLRNITEEEGIRLSAKVVKSSDYEIKCKGMDKKSLNHCISTSDTVIIDRVDKVLDIPDCIIRNVFKKEILDLGEITKCLC